MLMVSAGINWSEILIVTILFLSLFLCYVWPSVFVFFCRGLHTFELCSLYVQFIFVLQNLCCPWWKLLQHGMGRERLQQTPRTVMVIIANEGFDSLFDRLGAPLVPPVQVALISHPFDCCADGLLCPPVLLVS